LAGFIGDLKRTVDAMQEFAKFISDVWMRLNLPAAEVVVCAQSG